MMSKEDLDREYPDQNDVECNMEAINKIRHSEHKKMITRQKLKSKRKRKNK